MTEKIGNVKLNMCCYKGEDLYCDGDIENDILEIVKNHKSSEYNSIISKGKRWELMYHLSEYRENILNWYPVDSDKTVLEIGSGCGAVTGTLAERARKVTCAELSKKRSTINAFRHSELDNIEIYVGNFQDIEKVLDEKYDIVTLIGVLEYASSYIASDKPDIQLLKTAGGLLNEDGSVLIAIENKMGMKYWAGCKEDHVGRYYESIEGYSNTNSVMTYGKTELEEIFAEAGFSHSRFYYPYPDYKFAERIYSDSYLPKAGELGNNMRNFDNDRIITFDESKAFDTVIKNGLFPYYSNSFFVELKR